MNRQEAAEYFARKRDTLIWGLKDNRDETRQAHDAYNKAIDALRGPQPDPDTGLVPCGCGGKAGFHYSVMMRDNDCYVECGICGGHTKVVLSEDKARDAWNTAMGWKGGAE